MMRWRMMGFSCVAAGLLIAMLWMSTLPAPSAVAAPLLQPSPRPPVQQPGHSGGKKSSEAALGHVMGTVINTTTGAPAAGVHVSVGGVAVTTDANGNYDGYVPAGDHMVLLVLDPSQGKTVTPPQMVHVDAGAATIQHLSYASAAATAVPAATAAPTSIPPTATSVPPTATAMAQPTATAAPQPTSAPAAAEPAGTAPQAALPNNLPNTGGPVAAKSQPKAKTVARSAALPGRLPETAGEDTSTRMIWPLVALMLVLMGGFVMIQPRRAAMAAHKVGNAATDNAALLAKLLHVDDALLMDLLNIRPKK